MGINTNVPHQQIQTKNAPISRLIAAIRWNLVPFKPHRIRNLPSVKIVL